MRISILTLLLLGACTFEPVYEEVTQPSSAHREMEDCVVAIHEQRTGEQVSPEELACAQAYLVAYARTEGAFRSACGTSPDLADGCYVKGSDVLVVSTIQRTEYEIARSTRHEFYHHLLSCRELDTDHNHERREWWVVEAGACQPAELP